MKLTGGEGFAGDGGPASQARLNHPRGLAVGPDGSVYIADTENHRIRRVSPAGIITTIAGTGTGGYNGDGGLATGAQLNFPWGIAVAPDGSIYIGDAMRIRKVGLDGVITTIAGTGTYGHSGDGGPATEAMIRAARLLELGPDGSIYFVDGNWWVAHTLRKISPDGIISTIIPSSYCDIWLDDCGEGGPAYQGGFYQALGLSLGADGAIYLSDGNYVVRRIGADGRIQTIGGVPEEYGYGGEGLRADSTWLDVPQGMVATRDGRLLFGELGNGIREITQDGHMRTIVGPGNVSCSTALRPRCGDGNIGAAAYTWGDYWDFAEGPDGGIYFISWTGNYRVRKLLPWLPKMDTSEHRIASRDGAELFIFDSRGRHLETRSTLTGSLVYRFHYDSAGLLASVQDADSLITVIHRNVDGTPTAIEGPYGQRTELTLDSAGYLVEVRSPAADTTRLGYSAGGLLTTLIDARGNEKTYTYGTLGRLARDEDDIGGSIDLTPTFSSNGVSVTLETGLGRTSEYSVEVRPDGAVRRVLTAPDGTVTERVTTLSDSTRFVSPDSTVTTAVRRADPRFGPQVQIPTKASVRLPSGLQLALTAGRRVTLADSSNFLSLSTLVDSVIVNGRKFRSSYTQSNRTYVHTTPLGRVSTERLDSLGRIVKDSVAGFTPWTYQYDGDGRLTRAKQGSREYEYGYDNLGRLETLTDPLEHTVAFEYDAAGRVTRQVLPDSNEITFGYDRSGNLTSLTPPGKPAHTFGYDAVNMMQSYTAPSVGTGSSTTEYTYDLDRQLTRVLRPDSTEINMAYNSAGRLSTVTIPQGMYGYSYNAATGQLSGITSPDSVELGYTYDGALLTTIEWSGAVTGSVDVTYDNSFRVVKQRLNGADSVAFQYDNDGFVTGAGQLSLTRNGANGFLTGTTLGSVTTSQTYNPFGELASYTAAYAGNTLFHTVYTRDGLGRITRLIETVQGVTDTLDYSYNPGGRLIEVERNGAVVESYGYDGNGNRTSLTGTSGAVTATYDDQDRLLTYGNASYTYTAAGELSSKVVGTDTTFYTYDPLGNLVETRLPDGTMIEYLIDGHDRRVGRKVNGQLRQGLLYGDQLNPVAELDSAGQVVSRFVYGSRVNIPEYMVKDDVTYRIVADHLGSVRLVVNVATGSVAQRIDYDAYGRVVQDTEPGFQPFGFAGGLAVAGVNEVRFGARDYSADVGRFTSKDPATFDGGPNRYEYAHSDPINVIDPAGDVPVCVGAALAGGLIAGGIDIISQYLSTLGCGPTIDLRRALREAGAGAVMGALGCGFQQALQLWNAARGGALVVRNRTTTHAVEQFAERGVTTRMAQKAIEKGTKYYDRMRGTISHVLERGMASGKTLHVATDRATGNVTTAIIRSKFNPNVLLPDGTPRYVPLGN